MFGFTHETVECDRVIIRQRLHSRHQPLLHYYQRHAGMSVRPEVYEADAEAETTRSRPRPRPSAMRPRPNATRPNAEVRVD